MFSSKFINANKKYLVNYSYLHVPFLYFLPKLHVQLCHSLTQVHSDHWNLKNKYKVTNTIAS